VRLFYFIIILKFVTHCADKYNVTKEVCMLKYDIIRASIGYCVIFRDSHAWFRNKDEALIYIKGLK